MNWSIESLQQEQLFDGLGQLKSTRLPAGTVVITDSTQNILAVPGLSGGQSTSVDHKSRHLLLEVANFDGEEVARNSAKLNYRSEASKIFAGGINPDLHKLLVVRLSQLLNERISNALNWQKSDFKTPDSTLKVDFEYLTSRLDSRPLEYWRPILTEKLKFLGQFDPDNQILVLNKFYQRITNQDELLSELIRMIGFDKLQSQDLTVSGGTSRNAYFDNLLYLKKSLCEFGFDEVISRPFISEEDMLEPSTGVKLLNPSSSLQPFFRDNLQTSLLTVLAANLQKGEKEARIFEINKIYLNDDISNLLFPSESQELCLLWPSEDAYLGTSLVNHLSTKLKLSVLDTATCTDRFGQSTVYTCTGQIDRITLTEISNRIKKKYQLPLNKTFWLISLTLPAANLIVSKYKKYVDQSDYPIVSRSYSLEITRRLTWSDVQNLLLSRNILDCSIDLIPQERLGLSSSTDKLNFTARFTPLSRTLQNSEIQEWEGRALTLLN